MEDVKVGLVRKGQIVAFIPVTERERRVMNVEPQGIKQLPAIVVSDVTGELVISVFTNDVHKPVMRRYNVPHERDVQREDGVPVGDYWKELEGGEAVVLPVGVDAELIAKIAELEHSTTEQAKVIAEIVKTNKEKLEALQTAIADAGKVKILQDELAAMKKAIAALEKSGKKSTAAAPANEEQKETPPAAGDGEKK
jgi:hypothetical protein